MSFLKIVPSVSTINIPKLVSPQPSFVLPRRTEASNQAIETLYRCKRGIATEVPNTRHPASVLS